MELERIDCQWRTIERSEAPRRSRGSVQCEVRRAIYSFDHFSRFDVDTISLWDKRFVSPIRTPRAPARINGSTRSIAGAGRPRENPRFAIVQSSISVSRDECPVNWTVTYIKCAWTVVNMINFDWRSNLDIKSLQRILPMTNERKGIKYYVLLQ